MKKNNESHGIWRITPSMTLTEIIAQSDFDFQILDCEHGGYDYQTLEEDIRVCQLMNCSAYVRVTGLDKVEVQRCLDLGADGIVFPQLNNYADFKYATSLIQYPPNGIRGFNPFVRAGKYGFENIKEKKLKCIAIIETIQAVEEIDEILALEDLDIVYIGVYDLSAQLNCMGIMDSPQLIKVVNELITKCNKASKEVSLMVNNIEGYKKYSELGVNNFVHSVDTFQLKTMFSNIMKNIKK